MTPEELVEKYPAAELSGTNVEPMLIAKNDLWLTVIPLHPISFN